MTIEPPVPPCFVDMRFTASRQHARTPAVLTAIIFQELFIRDSRLALGLANPRPLIGLAAALVAWKTRSALWTIAVGALLMLVYQLVF